MTWEGAQGRAAIALYSTLVVLLFGSAALSVALVGEAGKDREVVLVPGIEKETVVHPGLVPDGIARDFAEIYIVRFENYTPDTIELTSSRLKALVAPRKFHAFSEMHARRVKLTAESGLVSQLVLHGGYASVEREGERIVVELSGVKRLYVADRLTQNARLRYRITIERGEPVEENPYGLFVTGHRSEPIGKEKTRERR